VTNDGATILSLLDIEHPAGKILVDLAQQQDKEVQASTTHILDTHADNINLNRSEMVLPLLF
jgi:chaperonin GroEL (HSP60 family)